MTNWTSKQLRADSYDDFFVACDSAGLTDTDDGEDVIVTSSHNHCLVLLGTLYEETGETTTDDEGNEVPVTEALDGYHANLKYKASVGLEALEIDVDTPHVKFQGD